MSLIEPERLTPPMGEYFEPQKSFDWDIRIRHGKTTLHLLHDGHELAWELQGASMDCTIPDQITIKYDKAPRIEQRQEFVDWDSHMRCCRGCEECEGR